MNAAVQQRKEEKVIKAIKGLYRGLERVDDSAGYRANVRLCLERARLITESYKETDGEAMVLRRAKALKKILENMTIFIQDQELIVGNIASDPSAVPTYPEMFDRWLNKAVNDEYKHMIDDEGRAELFEIHKYWENKCAHGKERELVPESVKAYSKYNGVFFWSYQWDSTLPAFDRIFKTGLRAIVNDCHARLEEIGKELPNPMTSCLAKDKVIYAGQPVAAVAATNPHIAEEAIGLIEVEYEELPAVIDVLEAMKPDAPLVHPDTHTVNLPEKDARPTNVFWYSKNNRGDIEAGFKEADVVLEKTYRTQLVHQGFLEPRASIASVDPDGNVTLWTDNQGIFEAREQVSGYLKIPMNRVKVIPVTIGGAFGGKSVQVISPLCVLLSRKCGRPVKIVTTKEETLKTSRPAPPSVITIKLGATKDGHLTAAYVKMIFDYGALYGMGGMVVIPFGSFTGLNPYKIPNFNIECFDVYTNKTPSGPYRGPTAVQAAFPVESQMDILAEELKLDPLEFRLKNAVKEGDLIAEAAGKFLLAPFDGVIRGLLHEGLQVRQGMKIGDLDPRNDPAYCTLISDKSLSIGGAVLEAILSRPEIRQKLFR